MREVHQQWAGMQRYGDNLFTTTQASGPAAGRQLKTRRLANMPAAQSNIEKPIVEVVTEFSDLITDSAPTR